MGLLCLRLGAGIALFHDGVVGSIESPHQQHFLELLIEAAAGLFLCAGLWHPSPAGQPRLLGCGAHLEGPRIPGANYNSRYWELA
jgi:hypothetical protein